MPEPTPPGGRSDLAHNGDSTTFDVEATAAELVAYRRFIARKDTLAVLREKVERARQDLAAHLALPGDDRGADLPVKARLCEAERLVRRAEELRASSSDLAAKTISMYRMMGRGKLPRERRAHSAWVRARERHLKAILADESLTEGERHALVTTAEQGTLLPAIDAHCDPQRHRLRPAKTTTPRRTRERGGQARPRTTPRRVAADRGSPPGDGDESDCDPEPDASPNGCNGSGSNGHGPTGARPTALPATRRQQLEVARWTAYRGRTFSVALPGGYLRLFLIGDSPLGAEAAESITLDAFGRAVTYHPGRPKRPPVPTDDAGLDFSTAPWASAPAVLAWLEEHGHVERMRELGFEHPLRAWGEAGAIATIDATDRVMVALGLHMSDLPSSCWLPAGSLKRPRKGNPEQASLLAELEPPPASGEQLSSTRNGGGR